MAEAKANIAASVKARLLAMARVQGRVFDTLLVRYALERLLFRLSKSAYRDRFVLKGGMLVAQWLDQDMRETRDMDLLGFGPQDEAEIVETFRDIMLIAAADGLHFDVTALAASAIRDEAEYGGLRLRTIATLERTRIPITLDIGFGDVLPDAAQVMNYPSLLDMERPSIRSYPPEAVMAEKFQAVIALGLANGRMKDFYDLWALPKTMPIDDEALLAAIRATFAQRQTQIPTEQPVGLSAAMANDPLARQRWQAYLASLGLPQADLEVVLDGIWETLSSCCARLSNAP
jgi:predicted nucleotidyltransferase component of viral defense system